MAVARLTLLRLRSCLCSPLTCMQTRCWVPQLPQRYQCVIFRRYNTLPGRQVAAIRMARGLKRLRILPRRLQLTRAPAYGCRTA